MTTCFTADRESFRPDVLVEPQDVHKDIIVHELLHLQVPNHGKLFKALLKAYLAKDIGQELNGIGPNS